MTLSTRHSKFGPWRSEAENATSRSQRLPTLLTFTRGWGRNIFVSFKSRRPGTEPPNSSVKGGGANHYPRAPALERCVHQTLNICITFVQRRPNVFDVGQKLYKCDTNVFCVYWVVPTLEGGGPGVVVNTTCLWRRSAVLKWARFIVNVCSSLLKSWGLV